MKCRFLKHVLVVMFMFCGFFDMIGQEISKADIILTLNHIQRLSQEQKAELATAQKNEQEKDDMIAWQANQINNLTIWGNKCEQAVKAIAEVLAVFFAFYLGSVLAGIVLKNFPSVEGWVVAPLCYVLIFLGTYYGVMTCIYAVSHFIPTVPVWHDVYAWVTHLHAPKLP